MKELLLIETIMSKDKNFLGFSSTPELIKSFVWINTPEGFDFWDNIDNVENKKE